MVFSGQIVENIIFIQSVLFPGQCHFAGTGNAPEYFKIGFYYPFPVKKVPFSNRVDAGAYHMKRKRRNIEIRLETAAGECRTFVLLHKIQVSHFLHKNVY